MIQAIIFDYDGVIVDSFSDLYVIYKKICNALKKKLPETIDEFRKFYGYTFEEAYKKLNIISPEDKKTAQLVFKKEIKKTNPLLFEGIRELLAKLSKEYKLFLLSSNYKEEIKTKTDAFNISNYFLEIVGKEKSEPAHFDKSQAIIDLIQKQSLDPETVVMIGDRNVDFDEAKRAGIKIILVEYGWGYEREKLNGYKIKTIINEPLDILTAIEEINNSL